MIKKMVAVWGSPGAGKSTIAAALAEKLAKAKQNVIVISTSTTVPALPMFIPTIKDNSSARSIGSLVTAKTIDNTGLKGKIHLHPKSDRIGFMGLCAGETPITYKAFERDKIIELFEVLNKSVFDYIIYDCESNPVYDSTTFLALETADIVLMTTTPNVKGIEFAKSQLSWLKNGTNFHVNRYIKICSMVKVTTPIDDVSAIMGSFAYQLPYSFEIEDAFHAGELIAGCTLAPGIEYEDVITQIAEVHILGQ